MAVIRIHKDPLKRNADVHKVDSCNLIEWLSNNAQELRCSNAAVFLNGIEIANSNAHDDVDSLCDIDIGLFDQVDIISVPQGTELVYAIVVAVVAAGIAIALAPKPSIPNDVGKKSESPNNQLNAATNSFRPREAIPDISGNVISYPDFIQPSYYEYVSNLKIVKEIFCIGVGQYDITDIKTENTLIDDLAGSSYIIHPPGSAPSELLNVRGTTDIDGVVVVPPDDPTVSTDVTDADISGVTTIVVPDSAVSAISLSVDDDLRIDGTYTPEGGGSPATLGVLTTVTSLSSASGETTIGVSTAFPASDPNTFTGTLKNSSSSAIGQFYTLQGTEIEEIWYQIQMPRGIRDDDGTTLNMGLVIQAQGVDELGNDVGPLIQKFVTISGNTLDSQFRTFKLDSSDGITPGRYRAAVVRTTDSVGTDGLDLVKIEDIQSVTPYTASFGDVTLLEVERRATTGATSARQSKINADVTRKLELFDFDTGTFDDGVYTATRDYAQYVMYLLHKVGKVPLKYIAYNELKEISDGLTFDELGYFDFTFDSKDISLRDRVSTACNAARVRYYNVGNVFRFVREQQRLTRSAMFNRRNVAPAQSSQTWKFTRANDYDSLELKYVDPESNAEAYIRKKINQSSGAIEGGLGDRFDSIDLAGCRNELQAKDRAELEIRKIKYLKRRVKDIALSEALTIGVGERVGWADFNDSEIFHGEVLAQDGDLFETSEKFTPVDGVDYYVYLTDANGAVSNSVLATAHPSTEFGFQASGLTAYTADGYQSQLGSRYLIASQSDVEASDFTVLKRGKPNANGECEIELIQYDDRVFEEDGTAPAINVELPGNVSIKDLAKDPEDAQSSIRFTSGGDVEQAAPSVIDIGNWIDGKLGLDPSLFEVKADIVSGSGITGSATGVWLSLESDRQWDLSITTPQNSIVELTITVREKDDHANTDSMNVRLRSEVYVNNPSSEVEFDKSSYTSTVTATTSEPSPEAFFSFSPTGNIRRPQGGAFIVTGSWTDTVPDDPSDYELRATLNSGDTPDDSPLNTWIDFGSGNIVFSLSQTAGVEGTKTCELSIETRQVSDTSNTSTATFTITSVVANPP